MRAPMIVVLAVVAFSAAAAVAAERTTDPDAALLRVARQRVDDLARLRAADIPVVRETLAALFVEGPLALSSRLAAEGYDVKVLDLNAASADYWQIGLRPDSDVDLLQRAGIVLWEEENWILLRVPRGLGAVPLLGARAFLSPLPHEPVDGPRATGEILLERADGTTDPRIEMMIAAASPAVIDRYWNDLVANPPTGTRHSASQGGRDAVAYVKNELEAAGVPAQFHHFDARYAPNVVGELRGAVTPERIYIVVGHLDSIPERGPAPGANDNASGSVNVLTAAAAMSCWPFRNTIRFIASMGEEQGIFGSSAYADEASERGDDIRGVLNFDMIGWGGDGSPLPENLDVNYNAVSEDLGRLFAQCATDYATGIAVDAFLCPSFNKSDHAPFWERGYKAIFGLTDNENFCDHPGHYSHYHETTDTIANCGDPAFFYGAVRTSIATLATLAEPFKVTFVNPAESCDVAPRVVLGDRDLNTDPGVVERVTVEVWSGRETGPEAIVLTEEGPDSMLFSGQVGTTVEPPVAGDGVVSIADQDTLWVRYVDALDCDGAAAVPYTESLPVAVKDPGQNTCRAGSVKLSPPAVACSDTLAVRLTDADLNRSSSMVETVTVTVSSTTEPNPEPLVLTETSPYSALFEGQIPVATGAASADGVLQVAPGDLVTATYHDADDGTGAAAVASDTGTADCAGPGIPSIVIRVRRSSSGRRPRPQPRGSTGA